MKKMRNSRVMLVSLLAGVLFVSALFWAGCSNDPAKSTTSIVAPEQTPVLNKVMAIQNRHTDDLMKIDGVIGTGTGIDESGKPIVKIFTSRPNVANVPASLDGVPVIIEETGDFRAFALTSRYRPVPIGVSIGNNLECAAGTLGCIIYIGGNKYILSNNHVMARENRAAIGEDIVQPGRYDNVNCANNVATDKIADLSDFEPLKFDGTNNTIDASIALFSTTDITCATLPTYYGFPGTSSVPATVGLAIKKVGRTTSLTTGTVSAINVTINVGYSTGTAKFVGQIMTSRKFCKSGDSGSLVVTNNTNENPVGLLFGGTNTGQAILNPIDLVLTRFNASICGN